MLAKKDLDVKYSIVWLAAGLGMLLILAFPQIIDWIGRVAGIYSPVNTTFLFAGMFVLLIVMTLTVIVSRQSRNLRRMVQEQAVLEARVRALEEEKKIEF